MKKTVEQWLADGDFLCECGKTHCAKVRDVVIESGAVNKIPDLIRKYGAKKVCVSADENTMKAAGERVLSILDANGIPYSLHVFSGERFEPDERSVGSAAMHFDPSCDMLITVGTGTLNDIGKIVAAIANKPYMIVGTAPSMDGFSSATSSMIRDGLKISLNSKCPEIVVGDLDILSQAPLHMIRAGIGDMAAKYVSLREWELSHLINGEYHCSVVSDLIGDALKKCEENVDGITKRDPEAVRTVMEGMVLAGIAANYAGISRPVSGIEHYVSHVWDMRALEFGAPSDLHGIQCGISTVLILKVFEYLQSVTPDRETALRYAERFDYEEYKAFLIDRLGKSADGMIALEEKEKKYDRERHAARLDVILDHFDEIRAILAKAPSSESVRKFLADAGAPTTPEEIGISPKEVHDAFYITKDIRDKYGVSRLCWDLGIIDRVADELFPC